METNVEYTYFFEDVVKNLSQATSRLLEMKDIIDKTTLVKKPTKKQLFGCIDTMLAESDAIWDKLAKLGKVK